VDDKLRTVIWDFAGEPIAPELLTALEPLTAPPAALVTTLTPYLNADEVAALATRAEMLLKSGRFPLPPRDRRAYPYPPL
jgi:hypothetical protein